MLAGALLVGAALGYALADAWYHDDDCFIAEWKCELGDLGFALFFWGGALGGLSLLLGMAAAGINALRHRGNDAPHTD